MVAVIGDIHGCFYTLKSLVEKIREKYTSIEIYSVGDLVDRGNYSFEVVEFVKNEGIKFTPGNHDYMMYYFIKQPTSEFGKPWLYNGYENTLISYGNHFDKINEHLDFIINMPLFYNLTDCFISHAGISRFLGSQLSDNFLNEPNKLEEILKVNLNREEGILWTRNSLLNIGKLQVVGHSIKKSITFFEKQNVVYIDTGAFIGNKLSSVIVENNVIIDKVEVVTKEIDITEKVF